MNRRSLICSIVVFGLAFLPLSSAWAQFPTNPTWTTFFVSPEGIEGLTGDNNGNFYVADRGSPCKVWRIDTNANMVDQVGQITATCRPSGLTFDANGDLFITTASGATQVIYQLTPNAAAPTSASATGTAVVFEVPGNNGLAFDRHGNLFISDGTNNQGIVWKVTGFPADCSTNSNCEELFRVPPRRNGTDLGGNVATGTQEDGVGSVRFTVPRFDVCFPDTTDPNCLDAQNDKQDIVANGLAFNRRGDLYVADTSRGAIWRVEFDDDGELENNQLGCDATFADNTLCWDNLWTADPRLEGIDGIALDIFGNIWASVNERNAIVVVTSLLRRVVEVFQNPADGTTLLRNGDLTTDPPRPMEFPTSPFLSGRKFCTSGADSPRRDNNPNGPGEGSKVTCIDQNLIIPGLPLPVE